MNEEDISALPVKLNIDYDATSLVNNTVTKAASTATNTLVSLWEMTFGWLDYYADRVRIRRSINLKKYQELVNEEVSKIPLNDLVEPKVSILGPAIQSSEFYFEEDHYREMFSKLIASSMSKPKQGVSHPSFVQIIQQMSSTDAILFKAFSQDREKFSGSFAVTRIMDAFSGNVRLTNSIKDLLSVSGNFREHNISSLEVSESITNLNRLGLISLCFTGSFDDKSVYKFIDSEPLVVEYRRDPNNRKLGIEYGILSLTTFGCSFATVCL